MDLSGTTRWRRGTGDRGWQQDWRRCSEGQPRIEVQQIRMERHLRARARSSPLRLDPPRTSSCRARWHARPYDDARGEIRVKWIAPRRVLQQQAGRGPTRGRAIASSTETSYSVPHYQGRSRRWYPTGWESVKHEGSEPIVFLSRIQKMFPVYCLNWVAATPASSP